MFWLLNNRIPFKEFKNVKKYMLTDSFLPLHICKKHLSPSVGKLCHISNLPLIGENFLSFQTKRFQWSYSKKYISLNLMFRKYLEPWKELTGFAWSKPLQRCWNGVTFGHLSCFLLT